MYLPTLRPRKHRHHKANSRQQASISNLQEGKKNISIPHRSVQIFQIARRCRKIIYASRVTWINFHTEGNRSHRTKLSHPATWNLRLVHPSCGPYLPHTKLFHHKETISVYPPTKILNLQFQVWIRTKESGQQQCEKRNAARVRIEIIIIKNLVS